jgi:hypothetical protein
MTETGPVEDARHATTRAGVAAVAVVALAGLSAASFAGRPWVRPGPHLHLPSCRAVNLGIGSPGDVLARDITLANAGAEPLELSVRSDCGSLRVAPARLAIPPRGEAAVTVSIRLSRRGTTETGMVHFKPVDSRSPTGSLQVMARCPAGIEFQPGALDFGPLPVGAIGPEQTVIATASLAPIDEFMIDTSRAPGVEVRRLESQSKPALAIRVRAGRDSARQTVPVVFRHPADESLTTELSVRYDPLEPVYAAPARIAFDADWRPVQVLVWRSDGAPLGPLTRWSPDDLLTVTDETRDPGAGRRRLVVMAKDPLRSRTAPCEAALFFAGSSDPITIAVELPGRSAERP